MPTNLHSFSMKILRRNAFVLIALAGTVPIMSLPVFAGYSINGKHRCEQGGAMYISGYKGMVSTPIVVFRGTTYTMRPYTPPGATFITFVADNQSGIELGVGKRLSLTNGNGSICSSRDYQF